MTNTDPRTSFKDTLSSYIVAGNLTKDDDATHAVYDLIWDVPETLLEDSFLTSNIDVIYTLKLDSVDPIGEHNLRGWRYNVILTPWTIDKRADSSGNMTVTGSKMLWKAVDEANRVIAENVVGSVKDLVSGAEEKHRLGSTILYSYPIRFSYDSYIAGTATVENTEIVVRNTWQAKIGASSSSLKTLKRGIEDFQWGVRHPLTGQFVANTKTSSDPFQPHKEWWWRLILLGDYRSAFYAQDVDDDVAGNQFACIDNADNTEIDYFVVTCTVIKGDAAQTQQTRTITLTGAVVGPQTYTLQNTPIIYEGYADYISYADA